MFTYFYIVATQDWFGTSKRK